MTDNSSRFAKQFKSEQHAFDFIVTNDIDGTPFYCELTCSWYVKLNDGQLQAE